MGFVFLPCPCVSPACGALAVPGNYGAPAVPCSDVHSMKILCVSCHLCKVGEDAPPNIWFQVLAAIAYGPGETWPTGLQVMRY